MATIDIDVSDHGLSTYIATPADGGPWPGVSVIHDALGMSQDLRNQANWLASEGYRAAAPDLFDGGTFLGCLRTVMRDFNRGEGPLFDKVEAVRQGLTHKQSSWDEYRHQLSSHRTPGQGHGCAVPRRSRHDKDAAAHP